MSLPPRNAEHGCDSVDEVFKKFSVDRFAGYEDPEVQGAEQHFEQEARVGFDEPLTPVDGAIEEGLEALTARLQEIVPHLDEDRVVAAHHHRSQQGSSVAAAQVLGSFCRERQQIAIQGSGVGHGHPLVLGTK